MKGELKVIKFLDDCNETQTHHVLVPKRKLNHLSKQMIS